jgi:hypothetical protein
VVELLPTPPLPLEDDNSRGIRRVLCVVVVVVVVVCGCGNSTVELVESRDCRGVFCCCCADSTVVSNSNSSVLLGGGRRFVVALL